MVLFECGIVFLKGKIFRENEGEKALVLVAARPVSKVM